VTKQRRKGIDGIDVKSVLLNRFSLLLEISFAYLYKYSSYGKK